jgi:hypothetical protein
MSLLLAVALTLSPLALAEGAADGFRMDDLGGTVHLPKGYASEQWTDSDLKAKHTAGVIYKMWLTPWQVDVSEDALTAWAERNKAILEAEGVSEVSLKNKEIRTIAGRPTAWMQYDLSIGGGRGVAWSAAFTGTGHVVHLRTVAATRNSKKAKAHLESTLEEMALDKGPMDTSGAEVSSDAGFAATLPDGWRAPLRDEMVMVRKVSAKVGEEGLAPDKCWSAVFPPADGEPDVIIACKSQVWLGPLDEHSFEGIEAEVHERYFGRSEKPVPPAEQVTAGDRVGLYYRPPVASHPVRLAMAPFDGGLMVIWGLSRHLDAAELDTVMMSILPTITYSGPDGGAPVIGADKRAMYYLKYRPTSPIVWGPALLMLGLVGGGIAASRRKKEEDDDDF